MMILVTPNGKYRECTGEEEEEERILKHQKNKAKQTNKQKTQGS